MRAARDAVALDVVDQERRDFGAALEVNEAYVTAGQPPVTLISADLDLTPEPREDHASYIASWLKVLKNDTQTALS